MEEQTSKKRPFCIAIDAIKQPLIIGVRREDTAVKLRLTIKSEIIPPSITDATPEIKEADVAILISDKLKPFTLIK